MSASNMGSMILTYFEVMARYTGIPVRGCIAIIVAIGILFTLQPLGLLWAFAVWMPVWGFLMYIYRKKYGG